MSPLDILVCAPVHLSSCCPSNLKEAIDWILRVTGKDGHDTNSQGNDAINALANSVKELLNDEVKNALQSNGETLIGKLADGLQQFIGYKSGTIKHNTNGIGLYNNPLERLQDAVLKFTEIFFQGFKAYSDSKYKNALRLGNHLSKITSAITTLQSGIGGAKSKFETAIAQLDKELTTVSGSTVDAVLNNLKKIKDLQNKQSSLQGFATAVKEYLGKVLDAIKEDENVKSKAKPAVTGLDTKVQELKGKVEALLEKIGNHGEKPLNFVSNGANGLKDEIDAINYNTNGALKPLYEALSSPTFLGSTYPVARVLIVATYMGTTNFLSQLQNGYQSYYQGATTNELNSPTSPKPPYAPRSSSPASPSFSATSNSFTGSLDGKGQSASKGADLKHFMDLMTFSSVRLNGGKTGGNVLNVMNTSFKDLAAASTSTSTYDVFLKSLKGNATEHLKAPTNYPLSALFYCSKAYFQGCQMKSAQTRPPSTIREMLYWLSGLQFAPAYNDLEKQIETVVTSKGLDVANSGSKHTGEQLTSDQVTEYLHTTWLYSPTVFCNIQEPGISDNAGEPWLHSLYSNSEFRFTYPSSGTALLYTLSNSVYALQFQFQFLYKQCEFDYQNGCGWWLCKFGSDVLPKDDTTVPSSFCGSVEVASGKHGGDRCGLPGGTPSPLQAFLTDKLKGFRRDPSDPYSHLAECTDGSMCHVPMGFKPANLRSLATGGHLMMALNFFCGKSNTPLPKLCHTLSCVTKRTPRTLSDVFGFTFHLTGQMFRDARAKNNDITGDINSALTNLIDKIPNTIKALFFDVTSDLEKMGSRFFDLSLHCHWHNSNQIKPRSNSGGQYCDHHTSEKAADLASLSGCTNGKNCGKYFEPLTISSGATFADKYALTYLSWAAYLTDDIYESLQGFLDRFSSLKCTGCKNTMPCTSHNPGDHSSQCKCPSIVQCSDALTVLYEYGFHFQDAIWLKGWRYVETVQHSRANSKPSSPANLLITS
ncbi:variant erythrocyte surface antigen-1 family protein [Babesia caballi]|uniref:Variant erythrocyte surface antigen-1 family protein n=1 Tax=Babesia caballi TaxID=5871 RepID=A0AAV4LQS0_BABCB|nr:variant erythrocyte surface antigen-1 family protein [Babesia caballi]